MNARVARRQRSRLRKTVAVLGAGLLVSALVALAPPSTAVTAKSADLTVSGTGAFSTLKVSVSQTTNLINQVVEVSWSGGVPTEPTIGSFDKNYLQIMQCWGDDPAGPSREQCQFGGLVGDSRGGNFAASRQVSYGGLVDPKETYKQLPGSLDNVNVPFASVSGKSTSATLNEFYDASSTNEIPFARTRVDGTGREFFEVETAREAPGLGCGTPVIDKATAARTGRSCWLAIVPRSATEVDGTAVTGGDRDISSPLSQSNWDHRIIFPLAFQPVGVNCPIGSAERRTVGQESVSEAMSHWQPALCQLTGTVYGFSTVNDDLARTQLQATDPELSFISRPLSSETPPAAGPAVYAPVALSGLAFAFNIDRHAPSSASNAQKLHDGERIPQLNLNARLVAKLLTQSYGLGVHPEALSVQGNPPDLLRDKEFLALNPSFTQQFSPGLGSVLEPLGLTDANRTLWTWINGDRDARAFLNGTPDPFGTKVNPNYKALELPRSDLPKSDLYCATIADTQPPLCTLDAHPYAADLHDAARSAARGDTLSRSVWDPTANPPVYKKGLPQLSGSRLVIALTDTASAARYKLPTANLLNAAGNLVAPSTDSLLAAAKTLTRASGLPLPNAQSSSSAAYPLTDLTYAATVPAALSSNARKDYSALLSYIAGRGQQPGLEPGDLPPGYAPLPTALRAQTASAAKLIATAPVGAAVPAPRSTTATTTAAVRVPPRAQQPVTTPLGSMTTVPQGQVLPVVTAPVPQLSKVQLTQTAPLQSVTAGASVGTSRYFLGVMLLLGAACALGSLLLPTLAARRAGGARA